MDYGTYPIVAAPRRITPDVVTFHDLRLDYGTYPAIAAPETSNVVSNPQKEAGLRHLSRNDYLWERPQMWEIFHKLRMDCDTCPAVAAPLRFVYLVSLETPDAGDVPQTENGLRHLFRSCCSFEINLICIPGDLRCGKCSTK
ncbi:hypothetical protein Taro_016342 [Colocasia esculenta]|uniref:Uncharacterized protein n=1 Tax=Colocasia esculenta TaxID=4460 RepID=A0A843UPZ4_COLES|nr:hypothetical protein [Colocasia esculenta]